MNVSPEHDRPLVDLSRIEHPAMKMLYPVVGPVIRRFLKIDEVNQLESDVTRLGTPNRFFGRRWICWGAGMS
jgi:hypothetical protein